MRFIIYTFNKFFKLRKSFLFHNVNWFFKITDWNKFAERDVQNERRVFLNIVLKTCVVENLKNDLSEHDVHDR
jgi:hypothetical protein